MNNTNGLEQLPPELQAAPREFDAWSQAQLLKEQDASTPSEPLYHYTGEQALKGILEHERLWCFGHQYQKDREEFAYSMEIARRVIRDVAMSDDWVTRSLCAGLIDLLDNNSITSTFQFYALEIAQGRLTGSLLWISAQISLRGCQLVAMQDRMRLTRQAAFRKTPFGSEGSLVAGVRFVQERTNRALHRQV